MRGICFVFIKLDSFSGIIPAGAGHFFVRTLYIYGVGDHPRRCGAFVCLASFSLMMLGSSPQVRGICLAGFLGGHNVGIIPAGAGHFH